MLAEGNCLVFRRCKDLRNMMEDMDKYQGETIRRDWFDMCERTIIEQGVVYILVTKYSFVLARHKPCTEERCIEVKPKKDNKRW